jgi:hypothetical protein
MQQSNQSDPSTTFATEPLQHVPGTESDYVEFRKFVFGSFSNQLHVIVSDARRRRERTLSSEQSSVRKMESRLSEKHR